jgi:thiamine biosynthesis lipoprotein
MLSHASPERTLVERSERIMASHIGIHVAAPPGAQAEARAHAAIEASMAWFREVDRRLSRFTEESELSRLNATAGTWRRVSRTLFTAVEESVAAAEASGGLFDPALLPVLEALGYDRDFKRFGYGDVTADSSDVPTIPTASAGAWRRIQLDRAQRRIRLPAGARLDLGGIAKGWAADVALERYFTSDDNVLIDVGGDLRSQGGPSDDQPWAIGIGDPRFERQIDEASEQPCVAVLTLGRGGLATSGATGRWWRRGGQRQHHLIDPRTGSPAHLWIDAEDDTTDAGGELIATATALAPTAAHAEVEAKVALLRGYPDALASDGAAGSDDRRQTHDVALLLVLGSGRVVCSEHLGDYLATQGSRGNLWLD